MQKFAGTRRRGASRQAFVRVAPGPHGVVYESFALDTPDDVVQRWRSAQLTRAQAGAPDGSLADDVLAYTRKPAIATKATGAQIAAHLALWVAALGGAQRTRVSVTLDDVVAVVEQWLSVPPAAPPDVVMANGTTRRNGARPRTTDGCLAPTTVRKRCTSLQSFFDAMRGKHDPPNPVVGAYARVMRLFGRRLTPIVETRGVSMLVVEKILAAMPDWKDTRRGTPRELSKSKLRARVIAYTGVPPELLRQIKSHALLLRAAQWEVPERDKGDGVESRVLPLVDDGVDALADFHAANAYGAFTTSALNIAVKRAARRVLGPDADFTLYDLRHSFLAHMYRVTRDEATVARFAMHAPGSPMTARYTRSAHEDVDAAAVAKFSTSLVERRRAAITVAPSAKKGGRA